ncbi:YdbL family protein [Novosphingobium sp. BL-52-GroH]|uniref:YdbL family protein n=1 Tax=Novosphingobium sp. BL-52-GroH TaxID=3349877 RepID=UPI00384E3DAC
MTRVRISSAVGIALGAAVLLVSGISAASAEGRSPAYTAARAAGQVGEQTDGYLGVVGNQGADVTAMVRDLNNQRRAVYTGAAAGKSTIQEYAFTTGCKLIRDTKAGEKYQGLDGSWKTRGAGAPELDPRCP